MHMHIKDNLAEVDQQIKKACIKVGRDPSEVTLIAVSKTKPNEYIDAAYKEGMVDFGENKVQELRDKMEEISHRINWHFIGHLQRNKVKYIIDKVSLIHSVDSLRLAEKINEEGNKRGIIVNILVQVNIANEESKFGVEKEALYLLIHSISKLSNVSVKGLMTIAPYTDNPEENRAFFAKMKELYVDIKSKNIDNVNMEILSMGMTNDFEVAIEEGATMIRVGTGIFGERNYK
ncbi:hypothetical protein EDC18_104105 [Natranaerovirga pectinivora]|uniref:Pyridoxal phosphate homeostasis protein n=1 Tax=Natranaerovirga pectinivora TaxID=682400 RepID=A0A4R3MM85_9FIRM|nr:YggS family pyridoxal phosphate-dependent enzyme [Natranaerovirga pectinivora]TCT14955.1 hypothetical protein EDC18_104105 [Natranaerovirga pectinivora]